MRYQGITSGACIDIMSQILLTCRLYLQPPQSLCQIKYILQMQSRKIRVLVIGTNKAFKQHLVNSLFATKMYFYNTVDRQMQSFVFRDAPKQSVSQANLVPGEVEFNKLNSTVPLADNNLVCSYFTYFYAQRKSRQKPTQTIFLVDCKLKLELPPQILSSVQLIDLPHLHQLKNQKQMYMGEHTASTISPDLILIAMHQSEYFRQNVNNIKRALFANHHDANFGSAAKMWVVKTHRMKVDREQMGLCGEMDMFYQYQGEVDSEFAAALARELTRIYQRKYVEREFGEPTEDEPLIKEPLIVDEPKIDVDDTVTKNHPLFLSKKELKSLSNQELEEMHKILSVDANFLKVKQYNEHMQRLGYNKRISLTKLEYTKQIFLFLLLGLITVWTGYPQLLIFAVIIALAAIERTRQHMRDNDKHITDEKKRHISHLYGRDGPATIKKIEIEKELKERETSK